MKRLFLLIAAFVSLNNALAYNEKDLEKFKRTGICQFCDLSGADLSRFHITRPRPLQGRVNLRHANLEGADLSGVHFRTADFEGANLKNANLSNGRIRSGRFDHADLENANLHNSLIQGTTFENANLKSADLSEAEIWCCYFTEGVNMEDTDFRESILTNVSILDAYLDRANFTKATLQNVSIGYSELQDANFLYAKCDKVILAYVLLKKGSLNHSMWKNCKFGKVEFRDVSFKDADIRNQILIEVTSQKTFFLGLVKVPWGNLKSKPRNDKESNDFFENFSNIDVKSYVINELSELQSKTPARNREIRALTYRLKADEADQAGILAYYFTEKGFNKVAETPEEKAIIEEKIKKEIAFCTKRIDWKNRTETDDREPGPAAKLIRYFYKK